MRLVSKHQLVRMYPFGILGAALAFAAACQSSEGGLSRSASSGTVTTGTNTSTTDGTGNGGTDTHGSGGEAGADTTDGTGGSRTNGSTSTDGEDGSAATTDSGGTGGTGAGGTGGTSGTGGTGIVVGECTFHTEPSEEGAGGQGGAGSEDVHLGSSNFIGDYLVDAAGMSLYIYGADYPGDCNNPPISNCVDDCALSWPIFDAGPRTLAEGLPDEAFGTFQRPDGSMQTTYLGWPLYHYKSDEVPGDLVGHGRGRIWFGAETQMPNIMVMRASEENGGLRYLASEAGKTLYQYTGDVVGTPDGPPSSNCTGDCLNDFQPFVIHSLRPASPIEPAQITVFVRNDTGELQIAYKGAPLYTSDLDARSGELQGAASEEWSVVEL